MIPSEAERERGKDNFSGSWNNKDDQRPVEV